MTHRGRKTSMEMSDIVERLRRGIIHETKFGSTEATMAEAADEIERLRAPPTEAEVEAAAWALLRACRDTEGEVGIAALRKQARAALEAAAKVREGK